MSFLYSHPKVTIASGTSLSPSVYIGAGELAGIVMSAGWDAAKITYQVSSDNVNFQDLYDNGGNEVADTAVAAHNVGTDAGTFEPWEYIKIRSGTGGTPVNQSADRVLSLVVTKKGMAVPY